MKKLCTLGLSQGLSSCIPILMWVLIGYVYGNSDYVNIFSLTYSFQSIWNMLYSVIIQGAIILQKKKGTDDYSLYWSSVIFSVIFIFVIYLCFILNSNSFLSFMGVGSEMVYFFVYALYCLVLNMVVQGIVTYLQFEGKESKGVVITLVSYTLQVVAICILGLLIKNELVSVIISSLVLSIFVMFILSRYIRISRFTFNFICGAKYRIKFIIGSVSMYIIYLFGISGISNIGGKTLITYTLMTLCTDTQWDIQNSALDTYAALVICKGNYLKGRFKLFKDSFLFSLLLLGTSLIMSIIGCIMYSVDIKYFIVLIVVEMSSFTLYCLRDVFLQYVSIEHPSAWVLVIAICGYMARIVVSVGLRSRYAMSLGVLVGSLSVVFYYILYRYHLKIDLQKEEC